MNYDNQTQTEASGKLLGFRSGVLWKKIIAVLWFAFFMLIIFAYLVMYLIIPNSLTSIEAAGAVITYLPAIVIPLIFSDFSLWRKLPGKNYKVVARIVLSLLVLSLCGNSIAAKSFKEAVNDNQHTSVVSESSSSTTTKKHATTTEDEDDDSALNETEPNDSSTEDSAQSSAAATTTVQPGSRLIHTLENNGFSEAEATAFYEIVNNCGLGTKADASSIQVIQNGTLTNVRMKTTSSALLLAVTENHIITYLSWNLNNEVPMYDSTAGGYQNYYNADTNAIVAWALKDQ
jgi:hypothetical protein